MPTTPRILVDGRVLQDGSAVRGIGSYLRGLLQGFEETGTSSDIWLLTRRGGPPPAPEVRFGARLASTSVPVTKRRFQPMVDPLLVGRALRRERPRLYHAVEYAQPLCPAVPVVVTVHDLIPWVVPHSYHWQRRERLLALRQLRHADAVIAVSQATADDLVRVAAVDRRRISVVHHGVNPPPSGGVRAGREVRSNLGLPERFVLAVGTFDQRKRIDALARVVAEVRRRRDVGLVIAGDQGNFLPAVRAAIRAAGIEDVTTLTGFVSADTLSALYQLAEVLLYTSSYEGFGLPPLEAMAAGTPAVVFANSSLPEVVGSGGLQVADGDERGMAEEVTTLLGDDEARRQWVAAGHEWVRRFTWAETARRTRAVYDNLLCAA